MRTKNYKTRSRPRLLTILLWFVAIVYVVNAIVPAPDEIDHKTPWQPLPNSAQLLIDSSWTDNSNKRILQQQIFDAVVQQISHANRIIVLDMFLFNAWQGPNPETHRGLSDEITQALLSARERQPSMPIVVITDPINTVYGGSVAEHLQRLQQAGILVVITPLVELQDSNAYYSALWRWLIRPFGNTTNGTTVAHPFIDEKVSLRSWLAMLNFKANHRKLLITFDASKGGWVGLVGSANPHDGSSAHRNMALQFSGPAAKDLLRTEHALLTLAAQTDDATIVSAAENALRAIQPLLDSDDPAHSGTSADTPDDQFIRILTEQSILNAVVAAIDLTEQGDRLDVLAFYLSHRRVVKALRQSAARGVAVRVLLDANNDAFWRKKNGVPNRAVANELVAAGVQLRWCATQGEQCHAKAIYSQRDQEHRLILGSANFTRRNLDNFNLETDVDVLATGYTSVHKTFADHFDAQWHNADNQRHSEAYEALADKSWLKVIQYRFQEASGIGTF